VDLSNYVGAAASGVQPGSESGSFYRKTPSPKAAAAGGGLDLDVPAFLRKQGGGSGSDAG
jgi:hypothetical protein